MYKFSIVTVEQMGVEDTAWLPVQRERQQ